MSDGTFLAIIGVVLGAIGGLSAIGYAMMLNRVLMPPDRLPKPPTYPGQGTGEAYDRSKT